MSDALTRAIKGRDLGPFQQLVEQTALRLQGLPQAVRSAEDVTVRGTPTPAVHQVLNHWSPRQVWDAIFGSGVVRTSEWRPTPQNAPPAALLPMWDQIRRTIPHVARHAPTVSYNPDLAKRGYYGLFTPGGIMRRPAIEIDPRHPLDVQGKTLVHELAHVAQRMNQPTWTAAETRHEQAMRLPYHAQPDEQQASLAAWIATGLSPEWGGDTIAPRDPPPRRSR